MKHRLQLTPGIFSMALGFCIVAGVVASSGVPKTRPVPQLIEKDGYPVEVHHVRTEDGYLIELHRIPPSTKKETTSTSAKQGPATTRVVLMPHCFLCNSAVYVVLGPGKALAYLLHDSGYDVWMMNGRGTSYSLNHTTFTSSDVEFWDFSFHEIAVHDLGSSLDYVLEETRQTEVDLVAYSMGTTVSFIAMAESQQFRSKVRRMAAIAPVAYITHVNLALVDLTQHFIGKYSFRRSQLEFPPRDWKLNNLFYLLCDHRSIFKASICPAIIQAVLGGQTIHTDEKNLDFYLLYTPDTTSTRLLNHFIQVRNSGRFRQYDYGPRTNKRIYGSLAPPVYNLSQIDVPIAFFSSKWDTLSTAKDTERLESELPNVVSHVRIPLYEFNHADFIWGENVHKEVYPKIIDFLFT